MIYNEFAGLRLSMLGMGGMRFPTHPDGSIDMDATTKLFDLCILLGNDICDLQLCPVFFLIYCVFEFGNLFSFLTSCIADALLLLELILS